MLVEFINWVDWIYSCGHLRGILQSFCFQKGVLVFDVAQFDGILKKITEFNNALLSDPVGSLHGWMTHQKLNLT